MVTTIASMVATRTASRDASQEATSMEQSSQTELRSSSFHQAYHEMTDKHVVEMDVLVQLRSNLAQLDDLHARMRFMMNEIAYLLKKS